MKQWISMAAVLMATAAPGVGAEGLRLGDEREAQASVWPQWQARRTVLAAPVTPLSLWSSSGLAEGTTSTLLVGDYVFSRPSFGWWPTTGRLRATTGLVLSTRTGPGLRGPEGGAPIGSLPYVGVGYSDASAKGGWSLSADLGLTTAAQGLGRLFGSSNLDNALRDLRFAPVVQIGVRYSF